MGKLKKHLSKKIPDWRYNYRQLLDEKGDQVTSTVTINTAYSGMKLSLIHISEPTRR